MSELQAEMRALQVLSRVILEHKQLNDSFTALSVDQLAPKPRAYCKQVCFGVMRYFVRLDALANHLLQKPIRKKDALLKLIIYLGLYQLLYGRMANHAVVNHCVKLTRLCRKDFAAGFINACLRRFLREQTRLESLVDAVPNQRAACPPWLYERLTNAWPAERDRILTAQLQMAPLTLCVNRQRMSRTDYLHLLQQHKLNADPCLYSAEGIRLAEAQAVTDLPGFAEGYFFVQDEAPQLAAGLLALDGDLRLLDACAAPGGKTAHIVSHASPKSQLTALEYDAKRLSRLQDNLQRLQLNAATCHADANAVATWWDGQLFDRILLDAPCSATGIIRRHPDISYLRQADAIKALTQQQLSLLTNLWPCLKPGGRLVYATCSILPAENSELIEQFLHLHPNAQAIPINAPWGMPQTHGRQILPGDNNMDGFYYCCLMKCV